MIPFIGGRKLTQTVATRALIYFSCRPMTRVRRQKGIKGNHPVNVCLVSIKVPISEFLGLSVNIQEFRSKNPNHLESLSPWTICESNRKTLVKSGFKKTSLAGMVV
jgi:hypothetical protein